MMTAKTLSRDKKQEYRIYLFREVIGNFVQCDHREISKIQTEIIESPFNLRTRAQKIAVYRKQSVKGGLKRQESCEI